MTLLLISSGFVGCFFPTDSPWPLFSVVKYMTVNQELASLQFKSNSLRDFPENNFILPLC